jgi:hypothetical protein
MNEPKKKLGRKLLVATVGLATISYVAACGSKVDEPTTSTDAGTDAKIDSGISSGNLVAPEPDTGIGSGNLVPPDTGSEDAKEDTEQPDTGIGSGNLVPPDTGS